MCSARSTRAKRHPTGCPVTTDLALLRQALADCAAQPAGAPQGLPGGCYTAPDLFDHECQGVLRRNWHCVCRADELPDDGDYLTLTLLGEPLLIVRDAKQIRALSNVCRHRGMPIAEARGNANRFVCRYHAWTYATDGALLRAPRMQNAGFDPKTCKLGSFAVSERFGFVYICLADTPPDLDKALTGLDDLVAPYQPQDYRIVHSAEEVWACNWKSLVENFMEGYHLSVVHPATLHGYTPTGLCKKGPNGPGFTSYLANYPNDIPARGQGAPGLPPEAQHRSTLFAVYPCQVVSIAASLLVSLSILPQGPGSISVRWTMSVFHKDLDRSTIKDRVRLWKEVNREDREKLEAMHRALGSVHATGGPLAGPDYEGTVHDFLLWLAAQDAG